MKNGIMARDMMETHIHGLLGSNPSPPNKPLSWDKDEEKFNI
jgi:hypothetical protein